MDIVCVYFGLSKREKELLPKETKKIQKLLTKVAQKGEPEEKAYPLSCSNCDAFGEDDFIHDEVSGDLVCTQCGLVKCQNMMVPPELTPDQTVSNPYFSEGNQFKSYWNKGYKRLKRFNYYVDTHMKPESDISKTTNHYKDEQREEVYSILKNMSEVTEFPPSVFQRVKILFHQYRAERARIHKLDLTLAALFKLSLETV